MQSDAQTLSFVGRAAPSGIGERLPSRDGAPWRAAGQHREGGEILRGERYRAERRGRAGELHMDAEIAASNLHDDKIRKEVRDKYICEVIHKKTCSRYFVINKSIRNCTNAQDGQMMVMYKNKDGNIFVREAEEFWEKFVLLE